MTLTQQTYTAFDGVKIIAHGALEDVALKVKKKLRADSSILIFSDSTGKEMDLDLRGAEKEVLQRLQVFMTPKEVATATPGPGRPKLGVVAREVSLLPAHWEWLSTQSGGASATLRRLVDEASKVSVGRDLIKQAQERTYKFMSSLAGNLPHYEEALRALYRKDKKKFKEMMTDWPADIRNHSLALSEPCF